MRKWLKHLKNQKGLTLIELLAVVVILGIIAAIAVPAIGNIIDNSKDDAHRSNALLIINAAKLGIVSGDLEPDLVNNKANITLTSLVDAGLLNSVPSDPSVDGAEYSPSNSFVTYEKSGNKGIYTITLAGKTAPASTYYNGTSEADLNKGTKPTTP